MTVQGHVQANWSPRTHLCTGRTQQACRKLSTELAQKVLGWCFIHGSQAWLAPEALTAGIQELGAVRVQPSDPHQDAVEGGPKLGLKDISSRGGGGKGC